MTWINADGSEMTPEVWDDARTQCFGMLMDGRAQPTGIRKRGEDATLLIVVNAHHDLVKFALPPCFEGRGWARLIDTNEPELPEADIRHRRRLRRHRPLPAAVRARRSPLKGKRKAAG